MNFSFNLRVNKRSLHLIALISLFISLGNLYAIDEVPPSRVSNTSHSLSFDKLATSWDEAIPLGNGMLGLLVWQKGENLRFSLDRADLWDLRPMNLKDKSIWSFDWIVEQKKKGEFKKVHEELDRLYDDNPAPTKIPGAALEFDITQFGKVDSVSLNVSDAICKVIWENNITLSTFVHGEKNEGWFKFEGVDKTFQPIIIPPAYNKGNKNRKANSLDTQDLITLGYKQGEIITEKNSTSYTQEGWGGFKYTVSVEWKYKDEILEGCWSISTEYPKWDKRTNATELVKNGLISGFDKQLISHHEWWKEFWNGATISIPDDVIEKQWYLDMYKFGSAARKDAPPIALQSIWTADNGRIPPWKGDYHHDLNTQLCYWPAYSGNHLDLEEGLLNWLWDYKENFRKYTHDFYGAKGINVPGSSSLEGIHMGGWSQYAYTPTASAWLAQHFYLHWRYSMDHEFLEQRAYPWIKEVAVFLEDITEKRSDGKLKLPLSSSPEIFNNEAKAWFYELTNYDLALIRSTFKNAAELAGELGIEEDKKRWEELLKLCPDYAVDQETGLMYAPGYECNESHRHHSHLMAVHPLGLIDISQGEEAQNIINNTVENMQKLGTDWWTGYSFSWFANVLARAKKGDEASEMLHLFAENFCLENTFHANGEQHNRGYSNFKYRPFTIEGNFAAAAAVQEMLLQSHTGIIEIFPAIPNDWQEVEFNNFRTYGAFIVSSKKEEGKVQYIKITSEKGGLMKVNNPFENNEYSVDSKKNIGSDVIEIYMQAGETLILKNI